MNPTSDLRNDMQKDPDVLEREIDQTRHRMDQTLDALGRKLSPGQLVDEALALFREHGGEFAANLGHTIKQNPMPVILTAVGISWMMVAPNRAGSHYTAFDRPWHDEKSPGLGDSIKSGTQSILNRAADAGDRVKSGAATARDQVANSWTSSKDAVRDTASTARSQVIRAREGFDSLMQDQPLLLGVLGLALGSAIGAMLPSTEQEDRLFGPARDETVSALKKRGVEAYDHARKAAGDVAEKSHQERGSTAEEPASR